MMGTGLTNGQLIKQIHDSIEKHANNSLRQRELTMAQMWVLMSLKQMAGEECALKELERLLGVAQSTCAGIVSRLAAKGLVEYFVEPADRRRKLVRLTPAGRSCCAEEERNIRDTEAKMFASLTQREQEKLHELLYRVYQNIK